MKVKYSATFIRMYKKLADELKEEVKEKVSLFTDESNHTKLKVHKLKGRLEGRYSFSVNYKIRIVFIYTSKKPKEATLLAIGDHDIYKE